MEEKIKGIKVELDADTSKFTDKVKKLIDDVNELKGLLTPNEITIDINISINSQEIDYEKIVKEINNQLAKEF